VEKNQYELCIEVLRRLNKVGVLENMIIIHCGGQAFTGCCPFILGGVKEAGEK